MRAAVADAGSGGRGSGLELLRQDQGENVRVLRDSLAVPPLSGRCRREGSDLDAAGAWGRRGGPRDPAPAAAARAHRPGPGDRRHPSGEGRRWFPSGERGTARGGQAPVRAVHPARDPGDLHPVRDRNRGEARRRGGEEHRGGEAVRASHDGQGTRGRRHRHRVSQPHPRHRRSDLPGGHRGRGDGEAAFSHRRR